MEAAMERSNERQAWINGEFVPESRCVVSFRDRSFKFGDGVFDMTSTFGHKLFKLDEHIDRLYRSLSYVRIDPGISPKEMKDITEELTERNLHLIGESDDYWVGQRISRGTFIPEADIHSSSGPTVIVECTPLPLKARAALYRDGIPVVVPATRRSPPDSFSPRAKSHNYLNLIMGDLEAKAADPEAWAVLLDQNGNVTEGMGSNFFSVCDGVVRTPRAQFVLPGVVRQTVIDLARENGIPIEECDIDLYDTYTADEAFLTSTSLCVCPVRSINGKRVGGADAPLPGPITQRLSDAFKDYVKFDFVAQYLGSLNS